MKDILEVPDLGSFEYTFTNRELEDVLGFMERLGDGGAGPASPSAPAPAPQALPFLPPSSLPLALQFQPHPTPPLMVPVEPSAGPPADPLFVSLDGTTPTAAAAAEVTDSGPLAPDPCPLAARPPPKPPQPSTTRSGRSGGGRSGASTSKPPISHSTVEKQRRDRINALIDELRDLVPPQPARQTQQQQQQASEDGGGANGANANPDARRPKHAVLADTIALVRGLRAQLAALQLEGGRGGSPPPPPPAGPEAAAAAAAAATAAAAAAAAPVSTSAPGPEGVEVAPGDGCLYVKVHARDRHGLLSDIVRTLKAVPLEITSAAISTTEAGNVYDVFQVVPAPGTPRATAEHIRDSVVAAMGGTDAVAVAGEKKRRAR